MDILCSVLHIFYLVFMHAHEVGIIMLIMFILQIGNRYFNFHFNFLELVSREAEF